MLRWGRRAEEWRPYLRPDQELKLNLPRGILRGFAMLEQTMESPVTIVPIPPSNLSKDIKIPPISKRSPTRKAGSRKAGLIGDQ
jgi:hypothetical protein